MEAMHISRYYLMDLKPSNVILDDEQNAILIDWELAGASPFFQAPEADGSWDVKPNCLRWSSPIGLASRPTSVKNQS